MSFFKNWFGNWTAGCDVANTVVYVPKNKIAFELYRKKHKYVKCLEEEELPDGGMLDSFTSIFRPETPPGMYRVMKKRPVGKMVFTVYRKKRIFVSTVSRGD